MQGLRQLLRPRGSAHQRWRQVQSPTHPSAPARRGQAPSQGFPRLAACRFGRRGRCHLFHVKPVRGDLTGRRERGRAPAPCVAGFTWNRPPEGRPVVPHRPFRGPGPRERTRPGAPPPLPGPGYPPGHRGHADRSQGRLAQHGARGGHDAAASQQPGYPPRPRPHAAVHRWRPAPHFGWPSTGPPQGVPRGPRCLQASSDDLPASALFHVEHDHQETGRPTPLMLPPDTGWQPLAHHTASTDAQAASRHRLRIFPYGPNQARQAALPSST